MNTSNKKIWILDDDKSIRWVLQKALEKNNYNYQIVLNEYFGIKESPKKEQTTNQQIYGEIRNLMDTGARKFRQEQDRAKAYQEYIEKQKKTE